MGIMVLQFFYHQPYVTTLLTLLGPWDVRFSTWRPRGLSKSVISRVIIGATPFRVLITLLITYLLSPLGL